MVKGSSTARQDAHQHQDQGAKGRLSRSRSASRCLASLVVEVSICPSQECSATITNSVICWIVDRERFRLDPLLCLIADAVFHHRHFRYCLSKTRIENCLRRHFLLRLECIPFQKCIQALTGRTEGGLQPVHNHGREKMTWAGA